MDLERIKEIHQGTAFPESVSVMQALLLVWNECELESRHNSTSQQQTIERLRDLVKRMYESMAEMQKDGLELYDEDMDLIEEAKQLLNTTEPIDQ